MKKTFNKKNVILILLFVFVLSILFVSFKLFIEESYSLNQGFYISLNQTKEIKDTDLKLKLIHLHYVSPAEAFCGSNCYNVGFEVKRGDEEKEIFDTIFLGGNSNFINIFDYKIIVLDVFGEEKAMIKIER